MTLTDSLVLVDPAHFEHVSSVFSGAQSTKPWLEAAFRRFDRDFDGFWDDASQEDLDGADEDRRWALNGAFLTLLGHQLSCFDTSIELMLSVVAQRNDKLTHLWEFFAALEFDIDLPASITPVEFGLLGVWSPQKLEHAAEIAAGFASRRSVEEHFAAKEYGPAERLKGHPRKDRALMDEWLHDSFWPTWQLLPQMLTRAVQENLYLGLVEED